MFPAFPPKAKALSYPEREWLQLIAASTDGKASIRVMGSGAADAHFATGDFGLTWAGDNAAHLAGYIDEPHKEIESSRLTDMLQDIWSAEPRPYRPAVEPEVADFDDEVQALDALLADVELPASAYDADGNLIIRAQAWTNEPDDRSRHDTWSGPGDGQVLRRSGTALSWGALDLADTNVNGVLLPSKP